jgi:hypothetical protein
MGDTNTGDLGLIGVRLVCPFPIFEAALACIDGSEGMAYTVFEISGVRFVQTQFLENNQKGFTFKVYSMNSTARFIKSGESWK